MSIKGVEGAEELPGPWTPSVDGMIVTAHTHTAPPAPGPRRDHLGDVPLGGWGQEERMG